MNRLFILVSTLGLIILCLLHLNATQQSESDLKSYLSGLQNKEVFFNDGTPPCTISQVADKYFIAKVGNSFSYVIPFHSICKIEILGEKNQMITIYLYYHSENGNK
jgi:hypothetical protein